jgi:hypothetical protein
MKKYTTLVFLAAIAGQVHAQPIQKSRNQLLDVTGTVGSSQGSVAAAYIHNWKIFKKRKIEVGLGARWTTYFGTKKDFLTAGPAKYTRSFTAPFLIFFAGQEDANFDTLAVQRPLTHSINVTLNLGYNITPKWYAGFNIDIIGYTFGRKTAGIFTSNGVTRIDPATKPAAFNLLLTGDHDRGSLNSEFFVQYKVAGRWHIKAVYQFLFVEYKTVTVQQQIPTGPLNDRFRNKANNAGLGLAYQL